MTSTRILLLLAALALACIAVGSANQSQGKDKPESSCPWVSKDSFRRLYQSNADPPHTPSVGLGKICKRHLPKDATGVICLGDPGTASQSCLLCCACSNGDEITYTNRTAPNKYPCGKNRKGKCNPQGKCEMHS
uniref:Putative ixostatin n=1 Tax=Ixodes ricinus TaxID=34613 RepID=A0A0K8R3K6_IXORI